MLNMALVTMSTIEKKNGKLEMLVRVGGGQERVFTRATYGIMMFAIRFVKETFAFTLVRC